MSGAVTPLADPWLRGRVVVLIYHRVREKPDPLFPFEVDGRQFREQLALLKQYFAPLSVSEALMRLREGTLPARAVCITFDDGYADNASIALPLLRSARIPATFFVSTDYLDGGRMWNDTLIETLRRWTQPVLVAPDGSSHRVGSVEEKRAAIEALLRASKHLHPKLRGQFIDSIASPVRSQLPDDLMMSSKEVLRLRDEGMEIGAHTASHPILAAMDNEDAREDIERGYGALASLLGEPPRLFAYPNGRPGSDYDMRHVAMARRLGFEAAFSTARGFADPQSDRWQLPRFTPWDRTPLRFVARLLGEFFQRQSAIAA